MSGNAAVAHGDVRSAGWGSTSAQPLLRATSHVVAAWNAADFLDMAAPYLTVAFFATAVAIRVLAGRKRVSQADASGPPSRPFSPSASPGTA